ncbi:hypothetical protein EMIT0196MI5_370009 [Pseudomonas sp. IT-196MI5]
MINGSMIVVSCFCAKTIIVVSASSLPSTRRVVSKFRHARFHEQVRLGNKRSDLNRQVGSQAALQHCLLEVAVAELTLRQADWLEVHSGNGEILLS